MGHYIFFNYFKWHLQTTKFYKHYLSLKNTKTCSLWYFLWNLCYSLKNPVQSYQKCVKRKKRYWNLVRKCYGKRKRILSSKAYGNVGHALHHIDFGAFSVICCSLLFVNWLKVYHISHIHISSRKFSAFRWNINVLWR